MSKPRIVIIGAGSAAFGLPTLSGLFAERDVLDGATISLVDIDEEALDVMSGFVRAANAELGNPFSVEATTDRLQALPGSDFVVVAVEVGRFDAWGKDWDIPIAHGVIHTFGENGGPGALSHSLRQIPLVLEICRDIEALAPNALVLNYSNPLTRVCLALTRYTDLRVVGLCHGIAMAYSKVGRVMGWITAAEDSPEEEPEEQAVADFLEVQACGLNHITFITELRDRRTGEDLYPQFAERLATFDPEFEAVSRRLFELYGLYPAQYDDHVGEYLAWARPDGHPFADRLADVDSEREELRGSMQAAERGEIPAAGLLSSDQRMDDRAPMIVAAVAGGRNGYELAVNIRNDGCIQGLPEWSVVEVPAVAGAFGVRGLAMGALPPGITALLHEQIAIQDRVVEAAVHGDRNAALQALLLDPVSGRDLGEAESMLEDLLAAHADLLPRFSRPDPVDRA
jgi:alpha-galactosidase